MIPKEYISVRLVVNDLFFRKNEMFIVLNYSKILEIGSNIILLNFREFKLRYLTCIRCSQKCNIYKHFQRHQYKIFFR